MFGSKALLLLNSLPQYKAIDLIAISLSGKQSFKLLAKFFPA
jgi:hypothetical protein